MKKKMFYKKFKKLLYIEKVMVTWPRGFGIPAVTSWKGYYLSPT